MKIALLYYSGAGNTKFIAQNIYKKLLEKSYNVELLKITSKPISKSYQDFDLYIVGFPVYDLVAPKLVTDLVENLKVKNKPIAYFCTKAFMSVDAIKELSDITTSHGLITLATLDLFMPGTDLLAFAAKKDSGTEKIIKLFHSRNIGLKIDRFIRQIEKNENVFISQKWYSHLSFLIPRKSKESFHDQYSKYIPNFHCLDDVCTECMICVKNCPRENISFADGIKFGSNCDMCLKCVHHCPVEAIQVGDATKGKVRYHKVEIKI